MQWRLGHIKFSLVLQPPSAHKRGLVTLCTTKWFSINCINFNTILGNLTIVAFKLEILKTTAAKKPCSSPCHIKVSTKSQSRLPPCGAHFQILVLYIVCA